VGERVLRFSHANIRIPRDSACRAAHVHGKMQSLVSTCHDATERMIANRQSHSHRATGRNARAGASHCASAMRSDALPVFGSRQAT